MQVKRGAREARKQKPYNPALLTTRPNLPPLSPNGTPATEARVVSGRYVTKLHGNNWDKSKYCRINSFRFGANVTTRATNKQYALQKSCYCLIVASLINLISIVI